MNGSRVMEGGMRHDAERRRRRWGRCGRGGYGMALVGSLLGLACGETPAPVEGGAVVRDSAGVEIVENVEPSWGTGEGWTVAPEPALSIGVLEGEEPYLLSQIGSPTLRSDGSLVLANGGTLQIRAFAPDGTLLWQAGRPGAGPGEFQALSWLGVLPGDSVMAFDGRNRRVTLFDPSGEQARIFTPQQPRGAVMAAPVALLDGSRVLMTGGVSFTGGPGAASEVVWPEAPHFVADTEGQVLDSLTRVPIPEMMVFRQGGSVGIAEVPIPRTGFIAARGDRVVSGRSQEVDLDVRDAGGAAVRRIRLAVESEAPGPGDLERAVDARLGADPDPEARRRLLRDFADVPLPDRFPVADEVTLEADGTIWLRIWRAPWESGAPERWRVFDDGGRYLGVVDMPEDFALASVSGDRVVGTSRDDLGVERVRVYELIR